MGAAEADNRAADRARHAAENKRTSQRQVDAINRRLGNTKNPGGDRRARQRSLARIAGSQKDCQRGADLTHDRRQQHRQQGILAQHGEVIDHQRHQPPVQAENHADLPERARRRTRQPRREGIHKLIAMRQHLAEPGRDRADKQKRQRHRHAQTEQRREEIFDGGGQPLVPLFFEPAAHPRRKNNRDHRCAVVKPDNRHAEKRIRQRAGLLACLKGRDHGRVRQRAANGHRDKGVAAKLFPGGVAQHQRKEKEQRVARGEPDFIGRAVGVQPAADHRNRQQPFQDTRCRQHADKGRKDPGNDINQTREQRTARRVLGR
ncbi:hypothetical protein BN133_3847 [Cronobacter dublinensis 582]|nr:hypothetical protein BN133_3847 [Cronobacter dublinensis 582]